MSAMASELGSDEALYASLDRSEDERALEALLERHWERSFRLALTVVRDPGAAEDVAQVAFIKVVASARAGRPVDRFGPFLRSCVMNEARMHLRGSKRRTAHEERAATSRPEGREGASDAAAVAELAEALPEKQRLPLELHYGLGYTHREVGELLECPAATVSSRIQDGLEELRRALAGVGTLIAIAALEALMADVAHARAATPPAPSATKLLARASKAPMESSAKKAARGANAARVALVATLLVGVGVVAGAALLREETPRRLTVAEDPAPGHGSTAHLSSEDPVPERPIATGPVDSPRRETPAPMASPAPRGPGELLGRKLGTSEGHAVLRCEGLRGFVLSRDGKRVVATTHGEAPIFDLDTRTLVAKVENPRARTFATFTAATLTPDEKEILTADAANRLRFWDAQTGALRTTVEHGEEERAPYTLVFSPDGNTLVTGGLGAPAIVWSRDAVTKLHELGAHADSASAIAFSPAGDLLATCGAGPADETKPSLQGYALRLWDTKTWKEVRAIDTTRETVSDKGRFVDLTHDVKAFVFTRDGARLYSLGGKKLRAWTIETGAELNAPLDLGGEPRAAALTPDQRTLVVALEDGRVLYVDAVHARVERTIAAHRNAVVGLAIVPGGGTFVTGSSDGTIRTFDLVTGEPQDRLSGHATAVSAVAFSADGRTVASAARDRTVCIWDARSGRLMKTIERPTAPGFIAFGPEGRSVIVDGGEHSWEREALFTTLDVATGATVARLELAPVEEKVTNERGEVIGSAKSCTCNFGRTVSADGRRLVLHARQKTPARVLELGAPGGSTADEVARIDSQGISWPLVALSGRGDRVAFVENRAMDWKVRLVDVPPGQGVRELSSPNELSASVTGLGISPDGRTVVVADGASRVTVFDAATGRLLREIEGVQGTAFSPDGTLLAGVGPTEDRKQRSAPQVLRVVSLATGEVVAEGKAGVALGTWAFAPDGRSIVAGDSLGGVSIFELPAR